MGIRFFFLSVPLNQSRHTVPPSGAVRLCRRYLGLLNHFRTTAQDQACQD